MEDANFTFTVSDGFCTYSYPLNISNKHSIDQVARKIYKAFKLEKENGTFIDGIKINEQPNEEDQQQTTPNSQPMA